MIPFWILFATPAYAALVTSAADARKRSNGLSWLIFGILLTLMIGFRYRVGGDWGFEAHAFWRAGQRSLSEIAEIYDPGFAALIWLFAESGFNVWTLNLACGAIFTLGLITFARKQPLPWLSITIAVPYLIIVVAMGYSRQSVAIGFTLLALASLQGRSLFWFLVFMALAASMHITATLLVPIGVLASRNQKMQALIIGIPVSIGLFIFLLQDQISRFVSGYIEAEYQSDGALIRIAMNALPAILFLLTRKRFRLNPDELRLWTVIALIGAGFTVLLYLSPSSTAVDRMALYFIPLQLFVFGRLPLAWAKTQGGYKQLVLGVIGYSAAVLFVWLNFANFSIHWQPYRVFPFEALVGISI